MIFGLPWVQVLFLVLIAAVLIGGFLIFLRRLE
jgi:hypothetical protein